MADANVFVSRLELRDVSRALRVKNPQYAPHVVNTCEYSALIGARSSYIFTLATTRHWNGWRKSVPELVRAVAHVREKWPGVRFVVAGDSDGKYEALAADLGLSDSIEFLGIISDAEKIRRMRECCIYLQPSRYEGFGVAIAEALSCGAPVVTSAVGAVPEVVGDCAEFVDGESPRDIARGVITLLENPARRAALSERGAKRVREQFSSMRHLADWRVILDGIL
jgi:glycosyltransferase involved in cell wall biosynthesis